MLFRSWNYTGVAGEYDFVYSRSGGSPGGYSWYDMASGTYTMTKLFGVDAAGNFAIANSLTTPSISLTAYTSSSIGGSSLAAGACASTTVAITGLTTAMIVDTTPATYPGDAYFWKAYASAAGTATVKVCAAIAGTPTASAYNLRVIQ